MEIEYYFHSTAYFYGSGDHEFCQDGYEFLRDIIDLWMNILNKVSMCGEKRLRRIVN